MEKLTPARPDIAAGRPFAASPDHRGRSGPFDIIGDVHGCADELEALLRRLGYRIEMTDHPEGRRYHSRAPAGRTALFVGDLVDRGPRSADVLRLVMALVADGVALCIPGNHDAKLLRWLAGRNVRLSHGLDGTVADLERGGSAFKQQVAAFLETLPIHLWLDGGQLAVAHAGIGEDMLGATDGRTTSFCLFGHTTGGRDTHGLPVRLDWSAAYRGETAVVYGHTPVEAPVWVNNTICIDTGCCFGGKLSALRWPEREIVGVAAHRAYLERPKPFGLGPPAAAPGVSD